MREIEWSKRRLVDDSRGTRRADTIEILGLRVTAHHGVHERERREGQPFVIDVVLHVDAQIAGRTDELADTIDYSQLVSDVAELVRTTRFNLLEALATHVADRLLAISRVAGVLVRITKPEVELPEEVDAVVVTVHRVRPVRVT